MAVTLRIEFVELKKHPEFSRDPDNVIESIIANAAELDVETASATSAGSRPQVPSTPNSISVRLSCEGGNCSVAWGKDPTATLLNGLKVFEGVPEVVHVPPGTKFSAIAFA